MLNNLNGIKKVRFCDFSEYDSEKCNTGGCYGFWTDYMRTADGKWIISYGTTADFEYCPVCGTFSDHYNEDDCCYNSGYECGEYENVTEDELLKLINEFQEIDTEYIEYERD